jgi:hypothetical protein
MPPASEQVFAWDEIPALARKHADGALSTYFPIFQINPA